MKKQRTIDKIITKVSGKYGAPMGRCDIDKRNTVEVNGVTLAKFNGKVFDCAVPMASDGYDKGGVYWGYGRQLRVSYTKDLSYVHFYRVGEK